MEIYTRLDFLFLKLGFLNIKTVENNHFFDSLMLVGSLCFSQCCSRQEMCKCVNLTSIVYFYFNEYNKRVLNQERRRVTTCSV